MVLALTHNRGIGLGLAGHIHKSAVVCLYSTCGWRAGGSETMGAPKTSRVGPVLLGKVGLPEPNNYFFYALV